MLISKSGFSKIKSVSPTAMHLELSTVVRDNTLSAALQLHQVSQQLNYLLDQAVV
jgi:hypothetical protein